MTYQENIKNSSHLLIFQTTFRQDLENIIKNKGRSLEFAQRLDRCWYKPHQHSRCSSIPKACRLIEPWKRKNVVYAPATRTLSLQKFSFAVRQSRNCSTIITLLQAFSMDRWLAHHEKRTKTRCA